MKPEAIDDYKRIPSDTRPADIVLLLRTQRELLLAQAKMLDIAIEACGTTVLITTTQN